ncbi:uncharacterized protein LOC124896191 [Capsicum annuum]|uniref:uncharacterized protein LOC124896191 n=1 Tax=Capsicum annuum TaxID=4072 RepID=UPI001FB107FD|nr:uncharacterized protein LOC124896191 [Capsicum annuum]
MLFEIGGDGILRYQGRLCVPDVDGLQKQILDEAHTLRYVVHPGSTKMYHDLKAIYWWNNMKHDVANFVAKCLNCQQVKTNGQAERTIQTLMDMLRVCVIDFKGSWVDHLPLIEFAYNNSYHASIKMAPFEALYGRRCRSPIGWYEVGETQFFGPDLVHQAMEDVKLIRERLKTAQSGQKSYVDVRRRDLEFEVGNWVFLKVSPMKGVMHFGKKGKLSPRYIRPYKKCIGDHSLMLPIEEIKVSDSLSYEEEIIAILDRQVKKLRSKKIVSVKVLWRNQKIEEATWESKDDMRARYPSLFDLANDEIKDRAIAYSASAPTAAPSVATSTTAASVAAPSAAQPSAAAGSVASPSAVAPSAVAPSVAAPSAVAPSAVAPSVAAPSADAVDDVDIGPARSDFSEEEVEGSDYSTEDSVDLEEELVRGDDNEEYGSDVHEEVRELRVEKEKFQRRKRNERVPADNAEVSVGEAGLGLGFNDTKTGKVSHEGRLGSDEPYFTSFDEGSFELDEDDCCADEEHDVLASSRARSIKLSRKKRTTAQKIIHDPTAKEVV